MRRRCSYVARLCEHVFVTFEGLDGSGTTTQSELLRQHLEEVLDLGDHAADGGRILKRLAAVQLVQAEVLYQRGALPQAITTPKRVTTTWEREIQGAWPEAEIVMATLELLLPIRA